MGRVIFDTATSLNGFIADEHNSLEWLFAVEDQPSGDLFPTGAGVMVEGSTTYEWGLAHWNLIEQPQRWTEFYGDRPTFVFTTRQLPVPAGARVTFVSGPVAGVVPRLRQVAGERDIWVVGGGDLAGQFFDADALDVLALSIAPVALTGGAPVFPRRVESDRLRLVSAAADGQFARLVYTIIGQR